MSGFAYQDPAIETDARVADLLGRMTVPEKLAQLTCAWLSLDPEGGDFAPYQGAVAMGGNDVDAVIALGLGHLARPFGSRPTSPEAGVRAFNAFQKAAMEKGRHAIPVLAHEEMLCGLVTAGATEFPCPPNWGSTFAPELVEKMASRIRRQALALGIRQGLSPVADVIRDGRWGRNEECISEDPLLVGAMVSAYVRGLQGDRANDCVIATLKHFAGYSGSDGGRNFAPLQAGERQLRELYLPPFERAVREAGALSVMNGYHEIDGVPCAANRWLLTTLLRDEWGFEGFVVADYFAVSMLQSLHGVAGDSAAAAALALAAGLDVELPSPQTYPSLGERTGELNFNGATLDESVRRVLRCKFDLGLFEQPFAPDGPIVLDTAEDRALARRIAAASVTLLSNDGTLPLDPATKARISIVGPLADDPDAAFGNYHYTMHVQSHFDGVQAVPRSPRSLVDALRDALPDALIEAVEGCRLVAERHPKPALGFSEAGLVVTRENVVHDDSGIAQAVAAASAADLIILAVGDRSGHFRTGTSGEGTDTDDLGLPGAQDRLAQAILDAGKPVVVVMLHGRPFALGRIAHDAAAIISAWCPGQMGPDVIADVIVGRCEPGGRSPVTYPRSSGQSPRVYNGKRLDGGVPLARDYAPAFPFGHGLSYTRFAIERVALADDRISTNGTARLTAEVVNSGERAGEMVAQLYARDPVAQLPRPMLELKGFARLALQPGERRSIAFDISTDLFGYVGPEMNRIVEPGEIILSLGQSSTDLQSVILTLDGPIRQVAGNRVWQAELVQA